MLHAMLRAVFLDGYCIDKSEVVFINSCTFSSTLINLRIFWVNSNVFTFIKVLHIIGICLENVKKYDKSCPVRFTGGIHSNWIPIQQSIIYFQPNAKQPLPFKLLSFECIT